LQFEMDVDGGRSEHSRRPTAAGAGDDVFGYHEYAAEVSVLADVALDEVVRMAQQHQRAADTSSGTLSRVVVSTVVLNMVTVFVGVWQVRLLTSFFRSKKLV
jgi:hypothetical protein